MLGALTSVKTQRLSLFEVLPAVFARSLRDTLALRDHGNGEAPASNSEPRARKLMRGHGVAQSFLWPALCPGGQGHRWPSARSLF
jgi:hypothetical protein